MRLERMQIMIVKKRIPMMAMKVTMMTMATRAPMRMPMMAMKAEPQAQRTPVVILVTEVATISGAKDLFRN
jgi:hypothetical protein